MAFLLLFMLPILPLLLLVVLLLLSVLLLWPLLLLLVGEPMVIFVGWILSGLRLNVSLWVQRDGPTACLLLQGLFRV